MRAYVVVEIAIHDPETYARYKDMTPAKALRQSCATTDMLLVEEPEFDPSAA